MIISDFFNVLLSRAGGAFVIPFIQQAEFQTLDTFNVDVSVEDIMTIDASSNALLRVGSTPELIAKALEQNGQVAFAMEIIDKLPEISASYAQAVASIDQLTVFDGAAGVSGQTNEGLAQSLAFIKDATGIDVAEIVNKRADGTTTLNRPVPVEEDK